MLCDIARAVSRLAVVLVQVGVHQVVSLSLIAAEQVSINVVGRRDACVAAKGADRQAAQLERHFVPPRTVGSTRAVAVAGVGLVAVAH
jgi:hypothetical protein